MKRTRRTLAAIAMVVAVVVGGCAGCAGTGEEESGTMLALDESYDRVRNGARLIMAYDAQRNAFAGSVENITGNTLNQVRVEVHLSNGVELGPTTPADVEAGESMEVTLAAPDNGFDGWTAHAEVGERGGGEHGHGEGEGEHGGEGDGEHGGEGDGGHR